jgi:hypothetical protein
MVIKIAEFNVDFESVLKNAKKLMRTKTSTKK